MNVPEFKSKYKLKQNAWICELSLKQLGGVTGFVSRLPFIKLIM